LRTARAPPTAAARFPFGSRQEQVAMKIVVIGATGNIGGCIVQEGLSWNP